MRVSSALGHFPVKSTTPGPDKAQFIVTSTLLYRSTWRSHCPYRSWTRAVASCCPSLTLTPTLSTSVARWLSWAGGQGREGDTGTWLEASVGADPPFTICRVTVLSGTSRSLPRPHSCTISLCSVPRSPSVAWATCPNVAWR